MTDGGEDWGGKNREHSVFLNVLLTRRRILPKMKLKRGKCKKVLNYSSFFLNYLINTSSQLLSPTSTWDIAKTPTVLSSWKWLSTLVSFCLNHSNALYSCLRRHAVTWLRSVRNSAARRLTNAPTSPRLLCHYTGSRLNLWSNLRSSSSPIIWTVSLQSVSVNIPPVLWAPLVLLTSHPVVKRLVPRVWKFRSLIPFTARTPRQRGSMLNKNKKKKCKTRLHMTAIPWASPCASY